MLAKRKNKPGIGVLPMPGLKKSNPFELAQTLNQNRALG